MNLKTLWRVSYDTSEISWESSFLTKPNLEQIREAINYSITVEGQLSQQVMQEIVSAYGISFEEMIEAKNHYLEWLTWLAKQPEIDFMCEEEPVWENGTI